MDEQEIPDTDLVTLARSGDKNAFGRLVERYQQMARHVAACMVDDDDTARELTQEAMLQAYLSLSHLRDDAAFRSWLYGIVLNVCRSYLRDQKTVLSWQDLAGGVRFYDLDFSDVVLDPQWAVEERELHHKVLEAVKTLPPGSQAATRLFYYKQLSLQEIAAILNISVTAVKGRLHKARQRLREQLSAWYPESEQVLMEQRRKAMVKVTIADVVKHELPGEQPGHLRTHYIIVLLDEAGRRVLPIWVGPWEGESLAIGLRRYSTARPMTFEFLHKLLEVIGVKIDEVRVEALIEDTFYAVVRLRNGDTVQELDARPSDALALAARACSPIFAAEEVLTRAGEGIPAELASVPHGKGLDDIMRGLEERMRQAASCRRQPTPEEMDKFHKIQQELVAFVFGGEG